jgi:hypothetical protein
MKNNEMDEIFKEMDKELKKLKWTLIASGVCTLGLCALVVFG